MENPVFQPASFNAAVHLVVGECNGIKGEDRWAQETPLFVEAISKHITSETTTVLDYGCGVGRLAKEILAKHPQLEILGVDDSSKQLDTALAWVNNERFETLRPTELNRPVDLAYCIYVLQHIPAIELRETLHRIHYFLKPGGTFIYCSSDCRIAVRFDKPAFFADRFLGINIRREVERFFEDPRPLFDEETMQRHQILRTMIAGEGSGSELNPRGIAHPALVYRRRDLTEPLFNAPLR